MYRVPSEHKALLVLRVLKVVKVPLVLKGLRVSKEHREFKVLLVL